MNPKSYLDFIIIGAQKSGTTSLFKYLIEHPQIYMPSDKETNFFQKERFYKREVGWFLEEFFKDAPEDKLWAEASPNYMTSPLVPKRIAKHFPDIKLIAILRDPIERAYSHYKMNFRRRIESRSFEEVIQQQLKKDALEQARVRPNQRDCCIVWGEYGRILGQYLDYFSLSQLLILFTRDLADTPENVMREIYSFLRIDKVLPQNIGERFHQGGNKMRFSLLWSFFRRIPGVRYLWGLLPYRTKSRLWFSFQQWSTIPEKDTSIPLTAETMNALQFHYQRDAILFHSITRVIPNWFPELEFSEKEQLSEV
jgi:hypothetical protein